MRSGNHRCASTQPTATRPGHSSSACGNSPGEAQAAHAALAQFIVALLETANRFYGSGSISTSAQLAHLALALYAVLALLEE
jgi:hypothetical protein